MFEENEFVEIKDDQDGGLSGEVMEHGRAYQVVGRQGDDLVINGTDDFRDQVVVPANETQPIDESSVHPVVNNNTGKTTWFTSQNFADQYNDQVN